MPSDKGQVWRETKAMLNERPVTLGPYFSFIVRRTPRRLLYMLSYYKFAAKMIGPNKRIIDVGCSEGLGTVILAEFAASCIGFDQDRDAIEAANASVASDRLRFEVCDSLIDPLPCCDAVVSLDTIEHIPRESEDAYVRAFANALTERGVCVIGTPNETSRQYASPWTNAGHINLFSADRLQALAERHFRNVFLFSANDEVVHTGFSPMAHYLIVLCVDPQRL